MKLEFKGGCWFAIDSGIDLRITMCLHLLANRDAKPLYRGAIYEIWDDDLSQNKFSVHSLQQDLRYPDSKSQYCPLCIEIITHDNGENGLLFYNINNLQFAKDFQQIFFSRGFTDVQIETPKIEPPKKTIRRNHR